MAMALGLLVITPLNALINAFPNRKILNYSLSLIHILSETPVALEISRRVLTLPLYADLPLEEVDHICDIILGMRN